MVRIEHLAQHKLARCTPQWATLDTLLLFTQAAWCTPKMLADYHSAIASLVVFLQQQHVTGPEWIPPNCTRRYVVGR